MNKPPKEIDGCPVIYHWEAELPEEWKSKLHLSLAFEYAVVQIQSPAPYIMLYGLFGKHTDNPTWIPNPSARALVWHLLQELGINLEDVTNEAVLAAKAE